jgi:FAD/FMN-containing dehydrogenase
MRLHEFVNLREDGASAGSTSSGSIATVAVPLGGVISRNGGHFFTGAKYTTDDATPNTPAEYKKYKRKK